jgi:geranylgeranyl diphosphate synthase, type I
MEQENLLDTLITTIEAELRQQISRLNEPHTLAFYEMLTYHMGWTSPDSSSSPSGKRLRPLLLLLTVQACEADWLRAAPAAAAVELVHNFSLVHDDIQDNSTTRRGRPTVWTQWGQAMAINVGDALFVLSNLAITDLVQNYPPKTVNDVSRILFQTCLDLTRGQYLDMAYEEREEMDVEDYWPMIAGKTASLLSASCHIGAILGDADQGTKDSYRSFGHALGLAFQIQDDLLGIWGDEALTGKSAASDLLEGKKSLPVIFGLKKNGVFAKRWRKGAIQPEEVEELAQHLASEGAYEFTYDLSDQMTVMAINSLREADPKGDAGEVLLEMANNLLMRKK